MIKILLITALYSAFVAWYWKRGSLNLLTKLILLGPILFSLLWVFILEPFVMTPIKTSDDSMTPSFTRNHYYMANRVFNKDSMVRGTVIVFKDKEDSRWLYKRIVGLPGEKVGILDGKIYINDQELNEPYLSLNTSTKGGQSIKEGDSINIPANNYFVLGDNRDHSIRDSRLWGTLPLENIIGPIWFKYY